jgi:methyltransferase (TIGR00027 family)
MLEGVGGTGLTVAGIRAAETERADRLFADPLAGAFVAAAGSPPRQATGRQATALRLWIVARTVFLDELILAACADGARQVALLGAGFDTRAFRLPWPPGVRCFELDTPDVLDAKNQVLAAQRAVPGCERITVPGNLLDDWPAALRAAGLRPEQPTAWVAEGLLVYLAPDDVDQLLDRVTSLSAPGSRLGLTFRSRAPADQSSPAVALRRSAAPDDPVGWLAGHGWAAQLADPRDVLRAHGRAVPADSAPGRQRRALLISAALDRAPPRSHPARSRRRLASAAPRPHLATPDGGEATVAADRPLSALLSQALVAFTIEFDNESEHQIQHRTTSGPAAGSRGPWLVSETMWANFMQFVRPAGVPLRDVAALADITNLNGLERWGYVTVGPDRADDRAKPPRRDWVVHPTAAGQRAQHIWRPLTAEIERRWRDRFGAEHVGALADALRGLFAEAGGQQRIAAGLVPYPGGWRAHPPYLSQTEALLADPAAALPYYPMVSHRGGFPDGS